MNKDLLEKIEDLGISVDVREESIDFEFWSPSGEDICFSVNKSNEEQEIKDVIEYCDGYDAEEHASLWVDCRGKYGSPKSIKVLMKDAEDIGNIFNKIKALLEGTEEKQEQAENGGE